MKIEIHDGVPEVESEEVLKHRDSVRIIDVRTPEEFLGELSHIAGAELLTLGPDLFEHLQSGNREEVIVFVCRSGARSAHATLVGLQLGYKSVANMRGGMLDWNLKGLPRGN